jgi:hypothetical protein
VNAAQHSIRPLHIPVCETTHLPHDSSAPECRLTICAAPNLLSPLFTNCYRLFVAAEILKSFAIMQIRTLRPKHPRWGMPRKNLPVESATYKLSSQASFANELLPTQTRGIQAFHQPQFTGRQPRSCPPFVFILLRIAFLTGPFDSNRYKLPGGGTPRLRSNRQDKLPLSRITALASYYKRETYA